MPSSIVDWQRLPDFCYYIFEDASSYGFRHGQFSHFLFSPKFPSIVFLHFSAAVFFSIMAIGLNGTAANGNHASNNPGVHNTQAPVDSGVSVNGTPEAAANAIHHSHKAAGPNDSTTKSNRWVEDPIAVTGIGVRLPGEINTAEKFWNFLASKGSGQCRVPSDRYNVEAFYGPGKAGHTCTEYGYFLQNADLAAVDTSFWSMSRKELEVMDPQQRLLLEVVYECLESAGAKDFQGKDIGCYVGNFGEDWAEIQSKDTLHSGLYRISGTGDFTISNRVSYEFGFVGPSMTVRTACSSSMMALYEACQGLYAGDCSSAIVGGTNLIINPHMTISMTEQGVLSPTGSSKSFDADADGYARGEAINAIYIKRLSQAVKDGDPVRAVIRSACVNSDGKTAGLSLPSSERHEALLRRSHELAGIADFSKTAMIECHGTGTAVGKL